MLDKGQIKEVVYRALDQVNELLLDENALTKENATILVGQGSRLDSMGFVNFVIALEEELAKAIGLDLNLLEELASGGGNAKRWSTVGELIDCLFVLARTEPMGCVEGDS